MQFIVEGSEEQTIWRLDWWETECWVMLTFSAFEVLALAFHFACNCL